MRNNLAVRVVLCSGTVLFLASVVPTTGQKKSAIFFFYDKDGFSATGKWIPADPNDKPAFPSETQIDCFKNGMSCVQATAGFYVGHPHIALTYLQVVKWDKDGIVATDSSGICMTVTMQIIFAEKRISSTHSMKQLNDETKQACNFFGAEKTQEEIFVLKGSERWNKEHWSMPEKSEKPKSPSN